MYSPKCQTSALGANISQTKHTKLVQRFGVVQLAESEEC